MTGSRIARGQTNKDVIKFSISFAITLIFHISYFIRVCKTWNILGCDLPVHGSPYVLNVEGRGRLKVD